MNTRRLSIKQHLLIPFVLLTIIATFNSACNQDLLDWMDENPNIPYFHYSTIYGRVLDMDGNPIANVQVRGGESLNTVTPVNTDENGIFYIPNAIIAKNRASIKAEKTGYFTKIQSVARTGDQVYMEVVMPAKNAVPISATTSQTVPISTRANVGFSANSYVTSSGSAYTGTVMVSSVYADPQAENFSNIMQGADLLAIDSEGEDQFLISYGAVGVELSTPSGETLKLASGTQATLRFQVPDDMLATAPAIMPLWYFDETDRKWHEQGEATLTGNEYIGQVSHFSWWNIDKPATPNTFVKGLVHDCDGNILTGAAVKVGPMTVYTNEEGEFQCNVPANLPFQIRSLYLGFNSDLINVSPLSAGELRIVDPISVNACFYPISGVVQNCDGDPVKAPVYVTFGSGMVMSLSDDNGNFVLYGNSLTDTYISSHIMSGTDLLLASANIPPITAPYTLTTPLNLCSINGGCIGGGFFLFWREIFRF